MRGIVTNDERQMIREKTGWECCQKCGSPIACAKDCCCARYGDEGAPDELSALADAYEAGLARMLASGYEEYGPDVLRKHRLVIYALRQKAADPETIAEAVCHDEQLRIWADEIISALGMEDYLKFSSYADKVDMEHIVMREIKSIVESAFDHPETWRTKQCICQEQRRRGYCTEPTCPYSQSLADRK